MSTQAHHLARVAQLIHLKQHGSKHRAVREFVRESAAHQLAAAAYIDRAPIDHTQYSSNPDGSRTLRTRSESTAVMAIHVAKVAGKRVTFKREPDRAGKLFVITISN